VLLAAQRDHEERKLRHLGYLFANVSFETVIDRCLANWCLVTARELTWGQFVLIEIVARGNDSELPDVEIASVDLCCASYSGST